MPVEGRGPGSRVRTEQHGNEAIDESLATPERSSRCNGSYVGRPSEIHDIVHAFRTNLVREPDAGNPHVRFDERGAETEWMARLSETPTRKGGNG
jgi:hypothetical protein